MALTRGIDSRFDAIKDKLVELGAVKDWEVKSWQTPNNSQEITGFLSKEGLSHDVVMKAIALSLGQQVYNHKEHGDAIKNGDGWILTEGHLWISDPFGTTLEEMLSQRERGHIAFKEVGVYIGSSRKREEQGEDGLGDTELDGLINELLDSALEKGASDIHISPRTSTTLSVQFRIDSHLQLQGHSIPMEDYPAFTNRLMNKTGGWGGSITKPDSKKLTHPWNGRDTQIRLETRPVVIAGQQYALFILRLMNSSGGIRKLEEIGFEHHHEDILHNLCNLTKGLFLVTGPTGSGKTTTLYALLQKIRELRPGDSIQTLEDPVEVEVPGIEQTSINESAGMTFEKGLRSAMRSDPDVILIGEIRDKDTATQAMVAAETGHLVLATLHTNSSAATINRLLSFDLDKVALANSLVAISAQRMVRKVCPDCSKQVAFNSKPGLVKRYKDLRLAPKEDDMIRIANTEGCPKCEGGYAGRHVVCELMMVDPATEEMIMQGKPASMIENKHVEKGFEPLWGHGISLAAKHVTTMEELESRLEPRMVFGDHYDYTVKTESF